MSRQALACQAMYYIRFIHSDGTVVVSTASAVESRDKLGKMVISFVTPEFEFERQQLTDEEEGFRKASSLPTAQQVNPPCHVPIHIPTPYHACTPRSAHMCTSAAT